MPHTLITRFLRPLSNNHPEDAGRSTSEKVDVEKLADTIFELEQSLQCQDLTLSPRERAELIAEAYETAAQSGVSPDPMDIDRLVWMKAG